MKADIYDSMAEGVSNAACLVVFMTQAYQDSANCALELKFAKLAESSTPPAAAVQLEGTDPQLLRSDSRLQLHTTRPAGPTTGALQPGALRWPTFHDEQQQRYCTLQGGPVVTTMPPPGERRANAAPIARLTPLFFSPLLYSLSGCATDPLLCQGTVHQLSPSPAASSHALRRRCGRCGSAVAGATRRTRRSGVGRLWRDR